MHTSLHLLSGILYILWKIAREQRPKIRPQIQSHPFLTMEDGKDPYRVLKNQNQTQIILQKELSIAVPSMVHQPVAMPVLDITEMVPIDPIKIEPDIPNYHKEGELFFSQQSLLPQVRMESSEKEITLTPEVFLSFTYNYLIRVDGEIVGYADDEKNAMMILNSMVSDKIKKYEKPSIMVSRKDLKEGKEVQIYSQSLGKLWNGTARKISTIDFVPVAKASYRDQIIN